MTTPLSNIHINYIILSHNIVDTHRAIVNAYNQVYSNKLKTIYVLYQEPFVEHIKYDLDVEIIQINVKGIKGQDWWMRKIMSFCDNVKNTDSVSIVFDEDDIYNPFYTDISTRQIRKYDAMWNYNMLFCDKNGINKNKWTSAISTLVIKTDILIEMTYKLAKIYPTLQWEQTNSPLDTKFRLYLDGIYNIGEHTAEKSYFFTTKSNTSSLNPTVKQRSIDA